MAGNDTIKLSTEMLEGICRQLKNVRSQLERQRERLSRVRGDLNRESGSKAYMSVNMRFSFGESVHPGELKNVLRDFVGVVNGCVNHMEEMEEAVEHVCQMMDETQSRLITRFLALEMGHEFSAVEGNAGQEKRSEQQIEKELRENANTYAKMREAVDTRVFNWKNIQKMVFLNAPQGAELLGSGLYAGHSAVFMIDDQGKGMFFSYFPHETSALTKGESRMRYLSAEETKSFLRSGCVEQAITSTSAQKIVRDDGYKNGVIKAVSADQGMKAYQKAVGYFKEPGQYFLLGNQCDDVATDIFFTSRMESALIVGGPGSMDAITQPMKMGGVVNHAIGTIVENMGEERNIMPNNTYKAMKAMSKVLDYELHTFRDA